MFSNRTALRTASASLRQANASPSASVTLSSRNYANLATIADAKPPIALYGLSGTYASALYTAAVRSQTLESTARSMKALKDLYIKDTKLATIMQTPTLSAKDKSAIVFELQKHIGEADKGNTFQNFLKTIAEYNRLGLMKDVCEKFGELMGAARGEVELIVTSATQLDNKTLGRLESSISKSQLVGQGKRLKIKNKVNPEIVGGLIIEINDRTIDLSVSSRLAKMDKLLTDNL